MKYHSLWYNDSFEYHEPHIWFTWILTYNKTPTTDSIQKFKKDTHNMCFDNFLLNRAISKKKVFLIQSVKCQKMTGAFITKFYSQQFLSSAILGWIVLYERELQGMFGNVNYKINWQFLLDDIPMITSFVFGFPFKCIIIGN
jgi:hypothetical protein